MIWLCALAAVLALAFFGRDTLGKAFRTGPGRQGAAPFQDATPRPLTARELLALCARLADGRASWIEISTTVNPAGDAEVAALLARLRAAHSGVDAELLRAVEDGCRAALAQNAEAGAFDALTEATRRSPWTSQAKW